MFARRRARAAETSSTGRLAAMSIRTSCSISEVLMRNETVLRMLSGFVLVGVFAAGALFGAGLLRWTQQEPQRLPPPPPGMGGGPGEKMRQELALDEQQSRQLDQILRSHEHDLQG